MERQALSVEQINNYLSGLTRSEAEGVLRTALDVACLRLSANYCDQTAEQLWDHFMSVSVGHHRSAQALAHELQSAQKGRAEYLK